jgi:hypothetical protein
MKTGDIITLENGDIMEVQLKKIGRKPGKLEVNKAYILKKDGEYCYTAFPFFSKPYEVDYDKYFNEGKFLFIGRINIDAGPRNIFWNSKDNSYVMFGVGENYIVAELD